MKPKYARAQFMKTKLNLPYQTYDKITLRMNPKFTLNKLLNNHSPLQCLIGIHGPIKLANRPIYNSSKISMFLTG
jgi:hypothetical protein